MKSILLPLLLLLTLTAHASEGRNEAPDPLLACTAPDVLYQITPGAWTCGAPPEDGKMGVEHAVVTNVHDGDTVTAEWVETRPVLFRRAIRVRHINAPEISRAPACEMAMGQASKAWAQAWFDRYGTVVTLANMRNDKFSRLEADVRQPSGHDLATDELAAGHAKPYEGEFRAPGAWCRDPVPVAPESANLPNTLSANDFLIPAGTTIQIHSLVPGVTPAPADVTR